MIICLHQMKKALRKKINSIMQDERMTIERKNYTMLFTLITGMLGIAGMRSYDKLKKTDTKNIKKW